MCNMIGVDRHLTVSQFANMARNKFQSRKRWYCFKLWLSIERPQENASVIPFFPHFSLSKTKYRKEALSLLKGTFFLDCWGCWRWRTHSSTASYALLHLPSLSLSASTEACKKSIKAYLNEERRDTKAPQRGEWWSERLMRSPARLVIPRGRDKALGFSVCRYSSTG